MRVIKRNCNFSAHLLSDETLSFEIFSIIAAHENIDLTSSRLELSIAVIYKTYMSLGQLKIFI